jgi:putative exporter of polyketide antibiotics
MMQDNVQALSDAELVNVIKLAQEEQRVRAQKLKRDTIARIKELAQIVGVSVNIEGTRGKPARALSQLRKK